jgi:predicted nucleic acid-binding protein
LICYFDTSALIPLLVEERGSDVAGRLLGLGGYDAIHLGSAESLADPDLVLVAGDRQLLRGAGELQIAVADLDAGY